MYTESEEIEILYEDDTELAEFEAKCKGYRSDVIVKIGDKEYKVYVTSMLRLQQDFEMEFEDVGYYSPEPNMILVRETTKKEIEDTILKVYRDGYFERIKANACSGT